MSGQGDMRVEAAVLAVLRRRGPRDVLDLLRDLRRNVPKLIGGSEGVVHALLHAMVKGGRLTLAGHSKHGLTRYGLPDASTPDAAPADDVPDAEASPRAARIAARVARGARDPAHRGRVIADVLAHLTALEKSGEGKAFGSVRAAREFVRRADRGRTTVCFVAGAGDFLKRRVFHDGPLLLIVVIAFFVVRGFLAEVFYIPSSSMEPNLWIDDRVLVIKPGGQRRPDRWKIVVFERNGTTFVKRAAGRGGEEIAIVSGDVFVDGVLAVKPEHAREALRLPYRTWFFSDGVPTGWRYVEEGTDAFRWTPDDTPLWSYGKPPAPPKRPDLALRDVYLTLQVDRSEGEEVALRLIRASSPQGRADRFAFTLTVSDQVFLTKSRHTADGSGGSRLAGGKAPPPGPTVLHLSYVDGVLRASAGDLHYEGAHEAPDQPAWPEIAVRGSRSTPRRLVMEKDVHYTPYGDYGVPPPGSTDPHPFAVPDGKLFLLGDNTYNSEDSRTLGMGPVGLDELVGPVTIRVWPPSRIGRVR